MNNEGGRLNGLDLFSGIGGLTLALSPWVKPVAYCENDHYAQGVLLSRMWDGGISYAPIWDDVSTLRGTNLQQPIDIVYGGFPCQDISVAGNGAGLAGERSGLFFQVLRLVRETSPRFVFLENVPAIRTRGLRQVIGAFAQLGFDCRWTLVSAQDIGAPHKRSRWFFLAYSKGIGREQGDPVACRDGERALTTEERRRPPNGHWWQAEPDVGRVADGVPRRMDRIRGLGNAVVPAQAQEAFKYLMGVK